MDKSQSDSPMVNRQHVSEDGNVVLVIYINTLSYGANRFGVISDLELSIDPSMNLVDQEGRENFDLYSFDIVNGLPAETLSAILTHPENIPIHLTSWEYDEELGLINYVPLENMLIPSREFPRCVSCGTPLEEHLDDLCCPNADCRLRTESRIKYYISCSGTPADHEDLLNILAKLTNQPADAKRFADLILPTDGDSTVDIYYGKLRNYLFEFGTAVARWMHHYDSIFDYRKALIKFVMDLSIPEITSSKVEDLMDVAIEQEESPFLLNSVGAYLASIDPIRYSRYINELAELDSKVQQIYYDLSREE